MKIENTKVYNIKDALRGMRNPKNSWERNDTKTMCDIEDGHITSCEIGPNDKDLAQRLIKAGTEHRKFMRQIHVSVDFTMPIYLVQEFDTYSIGKTRNSCSFQHKGASRDFNLGDFTYDEFVPTEADGLDADFFKKMQISTLANMNFLRFVYNKTKDYRYFRMLRQICPMGYNVKFTWTANYEVLLNMFHQRKNHKLKEWHEICDWIKSLPGMDVFLLEAK